MIDLKSKFHKLVETIQKNFFKEEIEIYHDDEEE